MSPEKLDSEAIISAAQRVHVVTADIAAKLTVMYADDLLAKIGDNDPSKLVGHVPLYEDLGQQTEIGLESIYRTFPSLRPIEEEPEEKQQTRVETMLMNSRARRGQQGSQGLKLTFDRKVSPHGYYQTSRSRWIATVPNSFGLPAMQTCPGKTDFCNNCYGLKAEQSKGVKELLEDNYALLLECEGVDEMTELLTDVMIKYSAEASRFNLSSEEKIFRIHWNGDFFSEEYAEAWAITMRRFPDIAFFAYTRSFREPVNVIDKLANVSNLELYLSCDAQNETEALRITEYYPGIHLAYCGEDQEEGETLVSIKRRVIACPENFGRMALMDDGVGACVTCQHCPKGKGDVIFASQVQNF